MSIRSEEEPLRRSHEARGNLLDRLRSLLGLSPASVREDIEDALEEAAGDVTPHERALLKNVLGLHDLRVEDAMIPRADIVAISSEATLREALAVFRDAGHSRMPVYAETLDDPRGMVHIRDFVNHIALCADAEPKINLETPVSQANLLKPVLFVPRSMPALDAGPGIAVENADLAHPFGVGDRRIWRHRRARHHRRHHGDDRRGHRG
jgi:CBS domain containing-hemolysin-like protein